MKIVRGKSCFSKGKVGHPWESTRDIYQHIPPIWIIYSGCIGQYGGYIYIWFLGLNHQTFRWYLKMEESSPFFLKMYGYGLCKSSKLVTRDPPFFSVPEVLGAFQLLNLGLGSPVNCKK